MRKGFDCHQALVYGVCVDRNVYLCSKDGMSVHKYMSPNCKLISSWCIRRKATEALLVSHKPLVLMKGITSKNRGEKNVTKNKQTKQQQQQQNNRTKIFQVKALGMVGKIFIGLQEH